MSEDEKEIENRKFQIALLEVQLKHDYEISFLTTCVAIVVSFFVTIVVLSFSVIYIGIPQKALSDIEWNFNLMEVVLFIILVLLSVAYSWNRYKWMPKELRNLQRFTKPKKAETTEKEKPKQEKERLWSS